MRIAIKRQSPPYIKWSECKSTDASNPDVMELKVIGIETFETTLTTNVKIFVRKNNELIEKILKLCSHNSDNVWLLEWWLANTKNGKLHPGKVFKLYTWLGVSKNDRRIRRFRASGL